MDEEGAYPRWLDARIDERIGAVLRLITAVQREAPTPAAGCDELAVDIGDEIRAIGDELAVGPKEIAQRAVDLALRIERRAQSADRFVDQRAQHRNVAWCGEAQPRRRRAAERGIDGGRAARGRPRGRPRRAGGAAGR